MARNQVTGSKGAALLHPSSAIQPSRFDIRVRIATHRTRFVRCHFIDRSFLFFLSFFSFPPRFSSIHLTHACSSSRLTRSTLLGSRLLHAFSPRPKNFYLIKTCIMLTEKVSNLFQNGPIYFKFSPKYLFFEICRSWDRQRSIVQPARN